MRAPLVTRNKQQLDSRLAAWLHQPLWLFHAASTLRLVLIVALS